jgi:hypothetical protein
MAGTGIRGQFEEKFRSLIQDIEAEVGRAPNIFVLNERYPSLAMLSASSMKSVRI